MHEHVFVIGSTRRCGCCQRDLPLEAFSRRGEGRQHWCKACFRSYFVARGDVHRRQSNAALEARRARAAQHVLGILERTPCADCGEHDPVVLEFDHVGPKTGDVGQLVRDGVRLDRLKDEIAQCEVVCACCHRRRTAQRRGSWRRWAAVPPTHRRHRQLTAVRERLGTGCIDCGSRDLVVLEFDHLGPKHDSVMVMAWSGYGLDRLRREMDECVVRCCNCHRRRTAASGQHFRYTALRSLPP